MPHLHSVIPPYILRRIIESGSEPQQRCARQTLTHVQTLMAHMPGKPAAPHVNKAGQLERDIYDAKQTQHAARIVAVHPQVCALMLQQHAEAFAARHKGGHNAVGRQGQQRRSARRVGRGCA